MDFCCSWFEYYTGVLISLPSIALCCNCQHWILLQISLTLFPFTFSLIGWFVLENQWFHRDIPGPYFLHTDSFSVQLFSDCFLFGTGCFYQANRIRELGQLYHQLCQLFLGTQWRNSLIILLANRSGYKITPLSRFIQIVPSQQMESRPGCVEPPV